MSISQMNGREKLNKSINPAAMSMIPKIIITRFPDAMLSIEEKPFRIIIIPR